MANIRIAFLSFIIVVAGPAVGDPITMVSANDLRVSAQIARSKNLLLVLEFSSEYCPFCRKLEELFLLPMQRNADYNDKILVRKVSLDLYQTVIDFDGRSQATTEFAARYGVSMTPTLLFLNPDGKQMSEKLVGIWSEDFYGAYIDERIDAARNRF